MRSALSLRGKLGFTLDSALQEVLPATLPLFRSDERMVYCSTGVAVDIWVNNLIVRARGGGACAF